MGPSAMMPKIKVAVLVNIFFDLYPPVAFYEWITAWLIIISFSPPSFLFILRPSYLGGLSFFTIRTTSSQKL